MFVSFDLVTDDEFLKHRPTDRDLRRLTLEYIIEEVRKLVIFLGMSWKEWDDMYVLAMQMGKEVEEIEFDALRKCCDKKYVTFGDIKKAVENEGIQNPHTICKVGNTALT